MKKALVLAPALALVPLLVHCVGDDASAPVVSNDAGADGSPTSMTDGSSPGSDSGGEADASVDGSTVDGSLPVTGAFLKDFVLPSGDAWFQEVAISPTGADVVGVGVLEGNETINGLGYSSQGGTRDVFVVDFDAANLGVKWAKVFGVAGDERGQSVAFDAAGGIYVAGFVDEGAASVSVAFGAKALITAHAGANGFVAKLDANGVPQWVESFDAASAGGCSCDHLTRAPGGGVAVSCSESGGLSYKDGNGATQTRANSGAAVFVAELEPTAGGVVQGTLLSGGAGPSVSRLAYDSKGALYFGGHETATFSGDTPAFTVTHKGYDHEGYVVKLGAGNPHTFAWAKNWGNATTTAFTEVTSVALDGTDRPFVGGDFQSNVDFGGASSLTASGSTDAFVLTLDPTTGNTTAQTQFGGGGASLGSTLLAFDDVGNLTVAAAYGGGPFTFGGTTFPAPPMTAYPSAIFTKLSASLAGPLYAHGAFAEDGGAGGVGIQLNSLLATSDGGSIAGGFTSGVLDLGDGTPITRTGQVGFLVQRAR